MYLCFLSGLSKSSNLCTLCDCYHFLGLLNQKIIASTQHFNTRLGRKRRKLWLSILREGPYVLPKINVNCLAVSATTSSINVKTKAL